MRITRGPWFAELLALALPLVSLAGCFAGTSQRAVTISHQADPDNDGDHGWLGVRLKSIEAPYPSGRDLRARVNGPSGAVTEQLCRTAHLADGTVCENPLGPDELWAAGEQVYLPCVLEGDNRFEIVFDRGLVLEEVHECGETPFGAG